MKRFTGLATVVAVLALAGTASAQDMPMRVGVIGGANFAKITGDEEDSDMKTGFDVGVLAQFPLGQVLTFQPEVHYTQWGGSGEVLGTEVERTYTYLHIPMLLRAGTVLAEGLDVDLLLGPYAAIALGCENSSGDNEADCTEDQSTDFGLTVGAGFSWAMGQGDLLVDGRFNLGFSEHFENSESKNQVIQVLVGYAFPFGGM